MIHTNSVKWNVLLIFISHAFRMLKLTQIILVFIVVNLKDTGKIPTLTKQSSTYIYICICNIRARALCTTKTTPSISTSEDKFHPPWAQIAQQPPDAVRHVGLRAWRPVTPRICQ